jgi:hypothetical protein
MRRKSKLFIATLFAVVAMKALAPAAMAQGLAADHVTDLARYFPSKLPQFRGANAQHAVMIPGVGL